MIITIMYKGNKEKCKVIKESITHYYVITDNEDKLKLSKDSKTIIRKKEKEKETDMTLTMLEKKIRKAKIAYYNDTPIMTDSEFDELEDQLRELDPNNKLLLEIGAVSEKNKVELPYYMPSLNKLKPDTASKWLEKNPGPYCLSDKIDGISVQLVSNKGQWNLYTRGDGSTGQDISYIGKYLKIPVAPSKELAIRAELVMTIAEFEAINEKLIGDKKAANARNFVGGLLNSTKNLNVQHIKRVDVVAYEVINLSLKPSEQFEYLEKLGFKTANWKVVKQLSKDTLVNFLNNRKKKTNIEMDGLVVSLDKVNKRTTSGNPKYSIAFKALSEEDTLIVTVVKVHWEPSKHGYLKPTVEIEPVALKGITITFATCHNGAYVRDHKIGPGTILKICRSGDVIPYILEVIKSTKAQLPSTREFDYEWTDSGVDIILDNALDNDIVVKKQITEFFRTLGVDNLSYGIISNLYDNGYDSVFKIIRMDDEISDIKGLGPVIAKKLLKNINNSLNVTLPILMRASSCFDRNLGLTRLEQVVAEFPDVLEMDEKKLSLKLEKINGFSSIISKSFVKGLPLFKQFLKKALKTGIKIIEEDEKQITSSILKNVIVVFTGFRNQNLEETIESYSGKIGSGLTSKTTYLLVKDKKSTSSKTIKARQLGVEILTEIEFKEKFNL